MRVGMPLWVIEDCEIALQIRGLEGGLRDKRIVSSEADNEAISA